MRDAKTVKGQKFGYLTGILYLAPSDISGFNVCAKATEGCKTGCLFTAGRAGIFPMINNARIRKTRELFANRQAFLAQLRKDIVSLRARANRENLTPCVRINGTSDLPWLRSPKSFRSRNSMTTLNSRNHTLGHVRTTI
jgi:hypothetical protein